jgi:hypothetical protein
MANKSFYVKKIGEDLELCLVYGWVETDKYSLFIRNATSQNIIKDYGVLDSKEAWEIYNSQKGYKE